MLPKGAIWQRLRTRALETVPVGVLTPYTRPDTVSGWLRSGAISVAPISSKRFSISTSPFEVGAALLNDSAFHLDHAAEHAVHVRHQLGARRWFSGAWQAVTFYYWSYFLALSLTRLTGTTGVFLSKDIAANLTTLSGSAVSAGPWAIACKAITSLGHREVELRRPQRTRLHELVWHQLFSTLNACLDETTTDQRDGVEERLYEAIRRSSQTLGDTWPSDLRNIVNYRPGIAYGAVRRTTNNDAFGSIHIESAQNFEQLLIAFENAVAGLPRTVETGIVAATKALVNFTFVLSAVAQSLHLEVIERRNIDRRWTVARNEFNRIQWTPYQDRHWPVAP